MSRTFTIEQAERLLPYVKQSMARMVLWQSRIEEILGETEAETVFDLPATLQGPVTQLLEKIQHEISLIQRTGAMVRGLDTGLVDFPSHVAGKQVLLCWRMGEERLERYHDHTSGFAGRRRLSGGDDDHNALN